MKTLYLLRHAKSSEAAASQRDFDRRLDQSGREAARLLGNRMAEETLRNALVICSPAVQTRETLELMLSSSATDLQVRFDSEVYDADLPALLRVLSRVVDLQSIVVLVGHNPVMETLLRFLTGEIRAIPAAGLAKINIPEDSWNSLTAA